MLRFIGTHGLDPCAWDDTASEHTALPLYGQHGSVLRAGSGTLRGLTPLGWLLSTPRAFELHGSSGELLRIERDTKDEAGQCARHEEVWGIQILYTTSTSSLIDDARGGIPLPQILAQQQKSGATANFAATSTGWRPGARCANYPQDASLVIVVKTGATEAFSKLPTLLLTYLSCVPPENVLFFSDMAGTIGNFAIHDSLDTATTAATSENPEFDLYNNQKELRRLGQDMGSLRNEGKSEAAWRLDKYKNLYTAQKAWDLAPERDWYLYVDADTYVSWTNLFLWLATLDSTKPLYLGSQVDVGRPPFAHGGSGYLLSKPAMKLLVGDDRELLAKEFDKNATTACCGDQELGKTLFKKGLKVQNVRPVVNGNNPKKFNFGPELWCTPVVTMHHVGSEEVQDIWDFENQRNSTKVHPSMPL
ncbi:hypothetical protein V493_06347 [Pseudogymnoascus sp. VKM F-4281 (FW-2241)]|nr:hypothetical protein V493_06347 [Pseudogymnoascus sp. VKM F-4281 (FW-2241)]